MLFFAKYLSALVHSFPAHSRYRCQLKETFYSTFPPRDSVFRSLHIITFLKTELQDVLDEKIVSVV